MTFMSQGLSMAYDVSGPETGLPIVFIHGFPCSRQMWNPQVEALKNTYRVICLDVRGHGESAVGDGQYSLEFFVDDLIALLDHLALPSMVVCGLSMGGYIALRAMERHPDRFRAAVLCDTRSEADSNEAKVKRAGSIKAIRADGLPAFADAFAKNVLTPETFTDQPDVVTVSKKMITSNNPTGLCGALLAMAARTDTSEALTRWKKPTLVLVGEKDAVTPPEAARAMHQRVPGSTLEIIPHAAHFSNLENPTAFNKHLGNFLATLP